MSSGWWSADSAAPTKSRKIAATTPENNMLHDLMGIGERSGYVVDGISDTVSRKGFTAESEPVGIVCLKGWISIVLIVWLLNWACRFVCDRLAPSGEV